MIVIVCLDKDNGMLFQNRRQSRDREVGKKIQQICKGKKLWMNSYSFPLYGQMESVEISLSDHFMWEVGNGEFCLAESDKLKQFEERIENLIVFRWDRKYPADVYLDLDLYSWKLTRTEEFAGYSHEKITEEIYVKGDGTDA